MMMTNLWYWRDQLMSWWLLLMLCAPIVVSVGWQCLGQIRRRNKLHEVKSFRLTICYLAMLTLKTFAIFSRASPRFRSDSHAPPWFIIDFHLILPSYGSKLATEIKLAPVSLTILPYFCVTWLPHKTKCYAKRYTISVQLSKTKRMETAVSF